MKYTQTIAGTTYEFDGLVELMAKATPRRSGDELAGCAADSDAERAAAAWQLADVPLSRFLDEPLVPLDPLGSGPDSSWRRRSARSRRSVTVCRASSMSSAGIASRTLSA